MENKQNDLILTNIEHGIQTIIFNRPEKKNALTVQMYERLMKIINESAENEQVHMLVFTGNGHFYSSGNDFISNIGTGSMNIDDILSTTEKFINSLITYPKLLVAIINGPAIGIAFTTLALFDIVYASETAYFLAPFCKLGLSPEACSSFTFPRILGPSKAGEILFFGEKLSANVAARFGFVSKVYKDGTINEVWKHLEEISNLSKESMSATKKLLSQWNKTLLQEINKREIIELKKSISTQSFAERIQKLIKNKM